MAESIPTLAEFKATMAAALAEAARTHTAVGVAEQAHERADVAYDHACAAFEARTEMDRLEAGGKRRNWPSLGTLAREQLDAWGIEWRPEP